MENKEIALQLTLKALENTAAPAPTMNDATTIRANRKLIAETVGEMYKIILDAVDAASPPKEPRSKVF